MKKVILSSIIVTAIFIELCTGQVINLDSGLVAFYPFNGNSLDESGNENHGNVIGAILVEDRFGNPESAFEFDGNDDYIEINDNSTLDLNYNLSISTWIYCYSISTYNPIVAKGQDTPNYSYYTGTGTHYNGGCANFQLHSDNSSYLNLNSNVTLQLGKWYHFVSIRENDTAKIYLDGMLSIIDTCFIDSLRQNDFPVFIGQYYYENLLFHGIIDDVRIYNRAIDSAEVSFLFYENNSLVDIKVFLEGPFFNNQMTPYLNLLGYLPLNQPYNTEPWFYSGTESVNSLPNTDIIDWVLVELRNGLGNNENDSIIAKRAGFILKNGQIVDLDGSSLLFFNNTIYTDPFAVVYHRNHLGIISASPLDRNNEVFYYDFTTDINKVFGGTLGHKEISPGVWGMIGGDGNSDGQVSNIDKIEIWSNQAGTSGYLNGDFDMDGQVDNNDKIEIWIVNSGSGSQIPN